MFRSDENGAPELDSVERLVLAVRGTPKYRYVTPELIRAIGRRELDKGRAWKEAVKAVKRKLHQVAGGYLDRALHYERWLEELRAVSPYQRRRVCAEIMAHHASTRERLPFLEEFYTTLLAGLPRPRSVLDIGCGLHPLAIPWMPLADETEYIALDIYRDLADFLNAFFALLPIRGRAEARDVLQGLPARHVEVAFMLKMIPCLEQLDKEAGRRLLDTVQADMLLVSFPVHSLAGRRGKGMEVNYPERFAALVAGRNWRVARFDFPTEIVFRVSL